jgi:lipoprotein-anchoring transpeptidase ErfK/SrfK
MPVLNYAPSAFGNMAHPPVDPKFDRQVVAYRGEEKPGTIVIDTPNRFLYLVEGAARPCATASASAVRVSPGPA